MSQFEISHAGDSKVVLRVNIEGEEVSQEYTQICQTIAKQVHVPGFRRGKVPLPLVRKRFASYIEEEMGRSLAPRYFEQAVEKEKIKPISAPHLDRFEVIGQDKASMDISFEVLPSIDVGNYRGLSAVAPPVAVSDEEVQESLESLRRRLARFLPVENRPARNGDFLSVDMKGKLEDGSGVEFQDRSVSVELGGEGTHPDITENLTGAATGETRNFSVTYASDFSNKRLAGKTVLYEMNVVAVRERQLPPLDDDLAKEIGDHPTLEDLKKELSEQIRSNKERERQDQIQTKIMEQLLNRYPFEPPTSMVEEALHDRLISFSYNLQMQGIDPDRLGLNWHKIAEESRPQAVEAARSHVIIDLIAQKESLEVSEEEISEEIRALASRSGKTPDAFRANLQKENRLEVLRRQLLRRKTRHFLNQHALID